MNHQESSGSDRFAQLARRVRVKRVYAPAEPADGQRVLVDRLWPRGLRKADAAIDRWLKEAAPSDALRRWFGHDAGRWPEFSRRYAEELQAHPGALDELRELAQSGPVTLLFAARNEAHNNAVALRRILVQGGRSAE
jgi:uncharacterized protein YeaO (DUF488 family)